MAKSDLIKNFGDKGSTAGFKQNPENINKDGRPRRSWNNFREMHPDVAPLTKTAYLETLEMLFNMYEDELSAIVSDKEQPLWLRYIVADMNKPKMREMMYRDLRDYTIGRAPQQVKVDSNDEDVTEVFIIAGKKIQFGTGNVDELVNDEKTDK